MPSSRTMVNLHPPATSEPSSPSSMNEGDCRLLLLAAVSQREQRVPSTPDPKGSSHTLISKYSPCITDVTAAAAAVKNNDIIRETRTVALPFKKRGISTESIATNSTADPTTFTLDENEDIMIQLHRNGLDQVKIPPLYTSEVPLPTHKRQVSEGTRDATSCGGHSDILSLGTSSQGHPQANTKRGTSSLPKLVTGGSSPRSTRQRQKVVMPASTTPSSSFPAPLLGRNISGSQDDNVVGRSAASMQKWGHDYHQQIMSMSMSGLSCQNQMLLMQAGPQGRLNDGMPSSALYCGEVKDEGRLNPLRQTQLKQPQKVDQGPFKNAKKDATSWSSKSNAGLSAPHNPNHAFYAMMSGASQMQHRQKAEMHSLIAPDESEGPLQKRRKKKNDTFSRATGAQEASKHSTTSDGKPIVFPNQEIYSEIAWKLRKDSGSKSKRKSPSQATEALAAKMVVPFYNNWKEERAKRAASKVKSRSEATEALAAKMVVPFYNKWREEEAEGARKVASATSTHKKETVAASLSAAAAAPPPSSSTWNPSLSVQKAEPGFMCQDQEESLMIQHRLLQMERAFQHEQKQQQLQRYLQLQQQQSRTQDVPWEQMSSNDNSHLSIMAHHQEPTLLSHDDPNFQVRLSLLELENQVRVEEHDRILQSNQRQMSDLHQHAIHLEEQMKMREMDFMRERKRLVDFQTVNRLRLQADELEKRLMM